MKVKIALTLLCMMTCSLSFAQSAPASEASINELLTVMNAQSLIDNLMPQVQSIARNTVQQMAKDSPPTAEQQAKIDKTLTQMFKVYNEELTWAKFQPMYVRIYQASFSQEEVDGMLTFYRSSVGQATVRKMPLVMQNTMQEVQKMMMPILQKTQTMARETQAAEEKAKSSSEPPKKKN